MKKGQTIGKYTIASELGRHVPPTFAAHASSLSGDPELVVLECITTADAPAEANDSFVKRARRLAQVRHPNICRIRDVIVTKTSISIASDYAEGETLAELLVLDAAAESKRIGLPEQLRILVDVLSGMSAIHLAPELVGGSAKNDATPFHGAIHPRNIVVGADGSARLVRVVRAPQASSDASERAIEEPGYAAPELLLGDGTAGARVDIYSVGVLLWEALSAKRLFPEQSAKEIVARQLAGALPRATPPAGMEWANALVEIAARALEVDPDKRFLSTAELAGALRLAVQARLAPASRIGSAVSAVAKEKLANRRTRLAPAPRAPRVVLAAKASPPKTAKIVDQKAIVALPSLEEDDAPDLGPVTKRFKVESLDEEDLLLGEDDEAVDSTWSSAPPAKKPSMAPPLKKASIAPPLPSPAPILDPAQGPSAVPPRPIMLAPASSNDASSSETASNEIPANESLETIAPVVASAPLETPGISAAAMPQGDASGAIVLPQEDLQRRKRVAVVIGMVAIGALILIVAGIRHATKEPDVPIAAASSKASTTSAAPIAPTAIVPSTAIANTAPTTNLAPASTAVADTTTTSTAQEISPPPSNVPSTPSPHNWGSHPTTPAKPAHKKPPHSSYEPEGI
ncbi:MAG: protein kinase [Polyangiaceae bacterium]